MNDRHRFRAWDKKNKRMWYNVQETYDTHNHHSCDNLDENCTCEYTDENEFMECSFGVVLRSKNYEVMQCTGLKDKDGKLIYEGDVIMLWAPPIFIIAWGGSQGDTGMNAGWYMQRNNFSSWMELEAKLTENGDNWEVLGNIYENPELLKKETP